MPASTASAIERKTGRPLDLLAEEDRTAWIEAHTEVVDRLKSARFTGLAIDYDGTLCNAKERFHGPGKAISQQLNRILAAGVPVVIVTGRGKSVGADLRRTLDRKGWGHASVGYYNGAQVAPLDDDQAPVRGEPSGDLLALWDRISQSSDLRRLGEWEARGSQLTLAPATNYSLSQAWELVNQLLASHRTKGIDAVRSGHTIDVIANGVSKRSALRVLNTEKYPCLCIGDSGRYPGNDFELLDTPYGLSCGEASSSRVHCWNLAQPGVLGTQATEYYLRAIRPHRGRRTFALRLGEKV
ncbi:MAG: HAD hydrolase family protein [Phycisphaerales bacterium]|nr:HAD hydrolase family protein [Phycisphaerales bacterium]